MCDVLDLAAIFIDDLLVLLDVGGYLRVVVLRLLEPLGQLVVGFLEFADEDGELCDLSLGLGDFHLISGISKCKGKILIGCYTW